MSRFYSFFILLFLLATAVFAQNTEKIVTAELLPSASHLVKGQSQEIAIGLHIREPFHINAHQPSEAYLIPTTVSLDPVDGVTFGKLRFPDAEMRTFSFSPTPLAVYEGTVYVRTSLSISPDIQAGSIPVSGSVSYQACNDHACFAPETVPFRAELPVAEAGSVVTPLHPEIFKTASAESAESSAVRDEASDEFGRQVAQKGLLLTFVLVFLGGLALNLTPCVYPLIPITISYFGGQAEGKKGSIVTHAVLYVLGMAITYSILGVIAAFTGGMFGAALQNPIVLGVIALILVGLSLSMFDLYEIRVPAFLANFAGGSRQGFFGLSCGDGCARP